MLKKTKQEDVKGRFLTLNNPVELDDLLEIKYSALVFYAYRMPAYLKYESFEIPKKSGGVRKIRAPCPQLKYLQTKLNYVLHEVYPTRRDAHGFVRNKSILTNARPHANTTHLLNIDIQDFFPSINFGRVRGAFLAHPYKLPSKVATFLAQIACFENELPQGSPSSPIISNIICSRLDSQMRTFAVAMRCRYTRYADDITFSSFRRDFPSEIAVIAHDQVQEMGAPLKKLLKDNGFEPNPKKTRYARKSQRQEVTGLIVNQFPNVPRRFVRELRAVFNAISEYGYSAAEAEHWRLFYRKQLKPGRPPPPLKSIILGRIAFLESIRGSRDPIYQKFLRAAAQHLPAFTTTKIDHPEWCIFSLECGQWLGTTFNLESFGLVSAAHTLAAQSAEIQLAHPAVVKIPVSLRKSDAALDLALLEPASAFSFPGSLRIGDSKAIRIGDRITLYGFPGFTDLRELHCSPGFITGKDRRNGEDIFLLNVPIYKGQSGGPVMNAEGQVIGVAETGDDSPFGNKGAYGVVPIHSLLSLP